MARSARREHEVLQVRVVGTLGSFCRGWSERSQALRQMGLNLRNVSLSERCFGLLHYRGHAVLKSRIVGRDIRTPGRVIVPPSCVRLGLRVSASFRGRPVKLVMRDQVRREEVVDHSVDFDRSISWCGSGAQLARLWLVPGFGRTRLALAWRACSPATVFGS